MIDRQRPNVTSPTQLRRLLAEYGIRPSKRLGQSFLVDANIVAKILAAAEIRRGDRVFEVGPGAGALTMELADRGAQTVALELDRRLVDLLRDALGDAPHVRIEQGDILTVDLAALLGAGRWKVCANLPYSIVGPTLARLLKHRAMFALMVLMVQREVAQRLAALPGTSEYGALSALTQAHLRIETVGQVPRTCFYPQPRVDSTLVRLTPLERSAVEPDLEAGFESVLRAAFRQRRKTLLNSLAAASELSLTRGEWQATLAALGIDSRRRPQSLAPAEFAALARALRDATAG